MNEHQLKNHQYDELLRAARETLSSINIPAATQHALFTISGDNSLCTISFDEQIIIDLTDLHITPQIDMCQHLTIFQYLAAVDDATPSDTWIGLSDLPGGMVRGASFDREVDGLIANNFSKATPETIW